MAEKKNVKAEAVAPEVVPETVTEVDTAAVPAVVAEELFGVETESVPVPGPDSPPLEADARANALAGLLGGLVPEPVDVRDVATVAQTGNVVDFGGRTEVIVLARHVNTTVKGLNVVARRGDIVAATAEWVARALPLGAVAKVNA